MIKEGVQRVQIQVFKFKNLVFTFFRKIYIEKQYIAHELLKWNSCPPLAWFLQGILEDAARAGPQSPWSLPN